MALLFQSGFELNSNTNGVEFSVTAGAVSNVTTDPRSGARHGRVLNGSGSFRVTVHDRHQAALGFHSVAIKIKVAPTADTVLMGPSNTAGVLQGYITLNTDRTLSLFKTDDTQIGADSTALDLDAWYVVELKNDASGSGSLEARYKKDGDTTWTTIASGANSNQGTWGFAFIGNFAFAPTVNDVYFDDWKVNDNSGTFQNSWPGDGKIITLRPNAGGDNNMWGTNAGGAGTSNNYTLVDELPPNDATDFVRSRTTNDIDDYNVEASGIASIDIVNAVQVNFRATRSSGTTSSAVVARLKAASSGSVTESSPETANSNSWRTNDLDTLRAYPAPITSYTKPGTSDPWTQTDLDAMQIGVRCSSGSGDRYVHVTALWVTVNYTPVTNVTETPSAQSLTFSLASVVVTAIINVSIAATALSIIANLIAPAVIPQTKIEPSAQAAAFSIPSPTVVTDQVLSSTAQSATFTILASIVVTDQVISAGVQTATFTSQAAAVLTNQITRVSVVGQRRSGGNITLSVNVTSGNALVAICTSQDSNRSNIGTSAITRDGQSFTKVAEHGGSPSNTGGPPVNIQIWVLTSPNAGTSNCVANFASINECTLTVYELSGCDISDLNEGTDGDEGSGFAPAMSVTTAKDDCFLIGGICTEANVSGMGTGQTQDGNYTDQSFENTRVSSEAGGAAGAQAHSYSMGFGTVYAQAVIAINPATSTDAIVNPSVQSAVFSIPSPAAMTGSVASASTQVASFSLPGATVAFGATIQPSAQSATFSIQSPDFSTGNTITAGAQALTISAQPVTVITSTLIQPSTQTAVINTQAPTVSAGSIISASPLSSVFSAQAVIVSAEQVVSCNVLNGIFTMQPASVITGTTVVALPQSISTSLQSITVRGDCVLNASTFETSLSLTIATVTAIRRVYPYSRKASPYGDKTNPYGSQTPYTPLV